MAEFQNYCINLIDHLCNYRRLFTGKKTHRYIIKKDDAEIFKRKLETDPTMWDTLKGHFGNQGKATNSKPRLVDDTEETSKAFKEYLIRL